MRYTINIYNNNETNTLRFLLGKSGIKPLFVVGLNPSTADDSKPDRTISKIIKFAELNGFDGFIMLNLYPQRTPFPNELDLEFNTDFHSTNIKTIEKFIQDFQTLNILAAWGEPIMLRVYLKDCLNDLKNIFEKYNTNWLQIGDHTKSGHPRHPSRAAYNLGIKPMDVNKYLHKLNGI